MCWAIPYKRTIIRHVFAFSWCRLRLDTYRRQEKRRGAVGIVDARWLCHCVLFTKILPRVATSRGGADAWVRAIALEGNGTDDTVRIRIRGSATLYRGPWIHRFGIREPPRDLTYLHLFGEGEYLEPVVVPTHDRRDQGKQAIFAWYCYCWL